MKILVITQFFPPDITAAAFRIGDMTTLLSRAGHEVKVLAGEPHKGSADGIKMDELVDPKVDIIRCRIKPLRQAGMRAYIGHYLSFVRSAISKGMELKKSGWLPDAIYCSSPPLFVGLAGRYLKFRFGKPVIFEVRDIWPDSAVAAGQLSEGGKAYKVGRMMEKNFYRNATHITCVAQPMAEYIRGYCKTPISVVYNGIREELVPPTALPAPNKVKTLLYAGNFGHVQDMELIVNGFIEATQTGTIENWVLRLIGTGAKLDELNEIVDAKDARGFVQIDPPVPRSVIFDEMLSADALYLSLQKSFVLEHTIPSKVFDYLAMSRPVVAALAGEGRQILDSTGANLCFTPGDETALQQALSQLCKQIDSLQQLAAKNRDLVIERFTREKAVEKLETVLKEVTS